MTNTEQIEQYLKNELSGNELAEFEHRMQNNPDFKKEVLAHKDVNLFIKNTVKADSFRKITSEVYNEYIKSSSAKLLYFGTRKKIAGFALLFIVLSAVLFYLFKPVSSKTLYAQNFEHYNIDIVTRSAYSYMTPLEQAIEMYQDYRYAEAIIAFSQLGPEDSPGIIAPFLCGISCLELNKNEEAIHFLYHSCLNTRDALYGQSCWYLALAYLKNDQPDKAIVILKQIKESHLFNEKKAETLLQELD